MSSLWRRQQREQREKEEQELRKKLPPPPPPPLPSPPPPPPPPKPKRKITNFRFGVSFLPNASKGGSHQFVLTLLQYLKNKCAYVDKKYDLLLVVADLYKSMPPKGVKVVQRFDGCFYDHGYEPGGVRDVNQREMSKVADFVVYQSQYGKDTMEDRGIVNRDKPSAIIYNGVNRSIYPPIAHRLTPTLTILSANNSRLRIKRVDRLNEFVGYGAKIIHLGQTHPSVVLDRNIQKLKPVSAEKLNNFFATSQAFIHTGDKDTCPNVVIQALSTGLPIIYWRSSGGVPELAGNAGLAVEDYPSMKDLLQDLRDNYMTYHNNALERARLFDMRVIGQQYLDVMRGVLNE